MPATVADPRQSLVSEQIPPATIPHHTVYEKIRKFQQHMSVNGNTAVPGGSAISSRGQTSFLAIADEECFAFDRYPARQFGIKGMELEIVRVRIIWEVTRGGLRPT